MIDRQELLVVLDQKSAAPITFPGMAAVLAWREELADAILGLDKPAAVPVTDTGTMFQEAEYANGFHYPRFGISHRLDQCNKYGCGPHLAG